MGAAKKPFDLQLPQLGPYALDFTRSGNYMVLGGRRGHLALLQWQQAQQFAEVQVCLVGLRLCTMRWSGLCMREPGVVTADRADHWGWESARQPIKHDGVPHVQKGLSF